MQLFAEITEKQVYPSLFNAASFNFPAWAQGTERVIEVIPVNRIVGNTINDQIFQPVSNGTAWNILVALGNGYLGPIAGTWLIQSGVNLTSGTIIVGKRYIIETYVAGDVFTNVGAASDATGVIFIATGTTPTTWTNGSSLQEVSGNLAYNCAASDIQTALNLMAIVAAAGGLVVILENDNFVVTWSNPGAQTTMIGNGAGLAPLSIVDISALIPGTTQLQAVQTIQLIQNPGAYQVLGNASAAISCPAMRTQIGGGGFNETWLLVIDSRSYAGVFNIVFTNAASAIQETVTLPYNTTDVNMQTVLQALTNIGANNCTVNQVSPWNYVIQFVGSLANTPINADAIACATGGLQVPLGRYDTLDLRTAALDLIQAGAASTPIKFEIRGTPPGGTEDYLFQGGNNLISSIVPPYSSTPAPTPLLNPNSINWGALSNSDPGPAGAWLNGTVVNVGP